MSRGLRLTPEQFKSRTFAKPSKYGNKKKVVQGHEFDSTKEANRYQELLAMMHAELITDLKCQQSIACVVNLQHICDYVADFTYYCRKRKMMVHEDCKSPITQKHPVYRLKKKLVLATTGIEITET